MVGRVSRKMLEEGGDSGVKDKRNRVQGGGRLKGQQGSPAVRIPPGSSTFPAEPACQSAFRVSEQ